MTYGLFYNGTLLLWGTMDDCNQIADPFIETKDGNDFCEVRRLTIHEYKSLMRK